ncbi:MAG: VWA domain-containing protein [Hyphomicrobiaceae bacterium]
MRRRTSLIAASALVLSSFGLSSYAQDAAHSKRIVLVLDASGSMNARMSQGQTRFDAARTAIVEMLERLPPDTSVALRVYGHQSKPAEKNCNDTELILPFGPAASRSSEIRERISKLHALGYTPISMSLQSAAEDLAADAAARGEAAGTVILVSDGRETCSVDPCAVSQALARANASLVVHTIGFGVDDATRRQLQCVANVARGSYFGARNASELAGRLAEAARTAPKAPPPEARAQIGILTVKGIDEAGVEVVNSTNGEHAGVVGTVGNNRLELPPGVYGVRLLNGLWTGVQIRSGETTELVPAYLKIATPAEANVTIVDLETSEEIGSLHQKAVPIAALVPGTYELVSDQGFSFGVFQFEAGSTTTVNPGLLRIANGKANHFYAIKSHTDPEVSGSIVQGQDVSLPAGKYTISDPDDDAAPAVTFDINAGQTIAMNMPQ